MTSSAQVYELRLHLMPLVASLLICSFSFNLSADAPQIRVSVAAEGLGGDTPSMVSALSREFRKLDGVLVTDTQPELKITCTVMRLTANSGRFQTGYAASVAITESNDRLIAHNVLTHNTIDALAHAIAVNVDGAVIEEKRRAAQPSPTP
jgi:hypothetical protein